MWIRSQDREELINTDRVYYSDVDKSLNSDYTVLGMYSSKEKAMKVMDMIQRQIAFCSERYEIVRPVLRSDPFEPYWKKSEVVFQLPKDDEVEV